MTLSFQARLPCADAWGTYGFTSEAQDSLRLAKWPVRKYIHNYPHIFKHCMIKLQHHWMKNLSRRAIVGYFIQQMMTRRLRYTRRRSPVKLWSCASRDGFGRVGSQSKACYVLFILKVDRFTDLIWQREATALKPTFWPLSVQMREPNLRRNWICALGNKLNSRSRTFQWDQWAGKLWSVCVINFFPTLSPTFWALNYRLWCGRVPKWSPYSRWRVAIIFWQ